ncbi:DUF1963 domain-containing protein [Dactylosporangium roseum]|uniref:DUF1963 domain-containing protein n=1 Tax=Dactylosporangium roseum TaxID=47989 RepID=A0ABY5Z1B8_9ACTN|nr:YwqG family protein [Dactylosporangium roseum]UWZ35825.1 DUF1963 domain-containing protein [Dactylosporangium roseum]
MAETSMADWPAMDVGVLRAALDDSSRALSTDLVEAVLSMVRPSVRLTVDGDGRPAGTYGGALPPGVDPPYLDGQPLVLLAQLRCAVLAEILGSAWAFPAEGSLLFFYDDELRDDDRAGRVLHVPDGDAGAGPEVIPALPLTATPDLSAPDLAAAELRPLLYTDAPDLMAVLNELRTALPYAPHQVLGWLDDGYYPDHGGVRPLLQLTAEQGTAWGECVRVAFVVPEEDLAAGRLDRARVTYEVA